MLENFLNATFGVLIPIKANRLKGDIGEIVSNTPNAFSKGRQILDSILIANE